MDVTKFNFLPASYDRIKYIYQGTITIPQAGYYEYKTVYTDGAGFFLPIFLISLDGEAWYDAAYPPESDNGTILARGELLLYADRMNIGGTRNVAGTFHFKVMGIEL